MALLKLKFLKSTNSLIVLLISLLGFSSSCKKDEQMLMYGVPMHGYSINGNVNSALDDSQIQDIKVEMYLIPEIGGLPQEQICGSARSDFHGRYVLNDYGTTYIGDPSYLVKFTDLDGALNGEYEPLDTIVVFKDVKFTGGDGQWDMGVAEKEVYVKLKPKK